MAKLNFNMFDEVIAISDLVKGSKFEEEKLKLVRPHIKKLQKAINVPEKELIYFCVIFRVNIESRLNAIKTSRDCCNLFWVADFLCVSITYILKDYNIFTNLFNKILYYRNHDHKNDLSSFTCDDLLIPRSTFESVLKNEPITFYIKGSQEHRSDFLKKIYDREKESSKQAIEEIKKIAEEYKGFDFLKNSLAIKKDREIFYALCALKYYYHYYNGDYNLDNDIKKYFTDGNKVVFDLANNNSYLFAEGYIEVIHSEILDEAEIYLTRKGMDIFFGEGQGNVERRTHTNLISPNSIKEKSLYYSTTTMEQLSLLKSSLEDKKLRELRVRLLAEKMNKGICALFYGEPGTGKTETVLQIAKATNRKVFHVDISEQKSCWFGESEKTIKISFLRNLKTLTA